MPTHAFGPENGTLRVRTGRKGAAAKAGHDLLIEVTKWQATVEAADGGGKIHTGAQITGKAASMGEGIMVSVLDALISDFSGKLAHL